MLLLLLLLLSFLPAGLYIASGLTPCSISLFIRLFNPFMSRVFLVKYGLDIGHLTLFKEGFGIKQEFAKLLMEICCWVLIQISLSNISRKILVSDRY